MEQEDIFSSTDSQRGAFELPYAKYAVFENGMKLEQGGELPSLTICYETYGTLNERKDNAVFICHALTGDSHVARHTEDDSPGWWDILIGPGKSVDTNKYFVICPNILGGCRGTTGPDCINPQTGKPYGADFPMITIGDMVTAHMMLIDHLGIDKVLAVIGGSMGGMMVLDWAVNHKDRLCGAVLVASTTRSSAQAMAFDIVARNAITRDPEFRNGQYYDPGCPGPLDGLAIARMLGHLSYLSRESMTKKFDSTRNHGRDIETNFETRFSVGSYLAYQADKFNERFDANTYRVISMAIDLFDMGGTAEEIAQHIRNTTCRWMTMSFTSDWLFPADQMRELVSSLISCGKQVSFCNIESDCGHDAFLLPNQLSTYGSLIEHFLRNVRKSLAEPNDQRRIEQSVQARFNTRPDYPEILKLIPEGSTVLDLGCGNGELMEKLREKGAKRLMGIEMSERAVQACVAAGFDVVQGDLNKGLQPFNDKQFDYVVLSSTLQTITNVETVLEEMLRVGQKGIVTFPNAGYMPWREILYEEGRMPSFDPHEGSNWYTTTNTRFLTIRDFQEFCAKKGYRIVKQLALDTLKRCVVEHDCNRYANMAIVILTR